MLEFVLISKKEFNTLWLKVFAGKNLQMTLKKHHALIELKKIPGVVL